MESVDIVLNSSDRHYPQLVHNHHEYCFLIESINANDTIENTMLKNFKVYNHPQRFLLMLQCILVMYWLKWKVCHIYVVCGFIFHMLNNLE